MNNYPQYPKQIENNNYYENTEKDYYNNNNKNIPIQYNNFISENQNQYQIQQKKIEEQKYKEEKEQKYLSYKEQLERIKNQDKFSENEKLKEQYKLDKNKYFEREYPCQQMEFQNFDMRDIPSNPYSNKKYYFNNKSNFGFNPVAHKIGNNYNFNHNK